MPIERNRGSNTRSGRGGGRGSKASGVVEARRDLRTGSVAVRYGGPAGHHRFFCHLVAAVGVVAVRCRGDLILFARRTRDSPVLHDLCVVVVDVVDVVDVRRVRVVLDQL